ncbi:hypothetical protein CDEST_03231 [Colletotrichum destructivum]|uniref:Uncharacterized protein n=1 Tax=Colletotrichum destructivum TaxID=34406 RepID=A0AAX4I4H7_9PEZI|nr:hypothetical protein CDEST_03231 [Colletotrichum destructivum]
MPTSAALQFRARNILLASSEARTLRRCRSWTFLVSPPTILLRHLNTSSLPWSKNNRS